MNPPRLSVVVVSFNMQRELPRTIYSLSPLFQNDIAVTDYEIIVVDNGSQVAPDASSCPGHDVRFLRVDGPNRSPVRAANLGMAAARGSLVGLLIDGARLASPGLLAGALRGSALHPRPVIASLGFHLGPEVQMQSVRKGYNQQVEDKLLEGSGWLEDGYRLFEIAVFAGSSSGGWFAPMSEPNGLFMPRELWQELGGLDEAFTQPGGGLANLDVYRRACALPGSQLFYLLGEGTFHQVHGGVATNAPNSLWASFHEEYVRLRGCAFAAPRSEPIFVGRVRQNALATLRQAAADRAAASWQTAGSGPLPTVASTSALSTVVARGSPPQARETCALPPAVLTAVQRGVMQTRYRGRLFSKSPFDIGIYLQLLPRLQARTVIEIGAKEGGSALWFADMARAHGVETQVVSIDLIPPRNLDDGRITLMRGDAHHLDGVLPADLIGRLPHPFLVVEDSAHRYESTLAVLRFFHDHLVVGDYVVVEDGVVRFLPEPQYRGYEDGPMRAINTFLTDHPSAYAIDRDLCDFYGTNATYNPNGYLRRCS